MPISKYSRPIEQTLEQYVPLPFDDMMRAGVSIQQRGDLAEQQQMQVETGLASLEASAPAYAKFRDQFVTSYKAKAGELLDKFGGNTSDPEFIRASKKLNLQFASDPRLQTLKQGNELIKSQQKIAQELSAKGIKYIDPNKNFTGADANGNLIAPTGSIRGTNFDEDITKSFLQIRDNLVDNGKGWKSNKGNLDRLAGNLTKNMETNPVTRDAIDYYKQQGLNDSQARAATAGLIKQAYTDNLKTDRDYQYDNMLINKQQLALANRREDREDYEFKAKLAAKKNQGITGLVPDVSQIDPVNLNKDLIKATDDVLKGLNSVGGLSRSKFVVEDTPENRKKYAGKFTKQVSTIPGGTGGMGSSYTELVVQGGHNKDHVEVIKTAREQLGKLAQNGKGGYLKDQTVLERYKDFLSKDNAAYTFWNTQSGDQLKQLDNVYVGTGGEKLGNATLIDANGKFVKTASKDFNMNNYDKFSFSGISAAPSKDFPNGAIKVSAVDKENGKIVQFLKPLDPQTASLFTISNKGYRALMSGKSNSDMAKDRSLYIGAEDGNVLVPQKTANGGINLFYINPNTGERLNREPLPFGEYVQQEHESFTNYLTTFSNKN